MLQPWPEGTDSTVEVVVTIRAARAGLETAVSLFGFTSASAAEEAVNALTDHCCEWAGKHGVEHAANRRAPPGETTLEVPTLDTIHIPELKLQRSRSAQLDVPGLDDSSEQPDSNLPDNELPHLPSHLPDSELLQGSGHADPPPATATTGSRVVNQPVVNQPSRRQSWCMSTTPRATTQNFPPRRHSDFSAPVSRSLLLHADSRDLMGPSTLRGKRHRKAGSTIWRVIGRATEEDSDDSPDDYASDVKRWSRLSSARDSILMHKEGSMRETSSAQGLRSMTWLSFGSLGIGKSREGKGKQPQSSRSPTQQEPPPQPMLRGRTLRTRRGGLLTRSSTPPLHRSSSSARRGSPCAMPGALNTSVSCSSPSPSRSRDTSRGRSRQPAPPTPPRSDSRQPPTSERPPLLPAALPVPGQCPTLETMALVPGGTSVASGSEACTAVDESPPVIEIIDGLLADCQGAGFGVSAPPQQLQQQRREPSQPPKQQQAIAKSPTRGIVKKAQTAMEGWPVAGASASIGSPNSARESPTHRKLPRYNTSAVTGDVECSHAQLEPEPPAQTCKSTAFGKVQQAGAGFCRRSPTAGRPSDRT